MAVNTAQIKSELFPGLRAVEGKYKEIELQYNKIFAVGKSNMALELVTSMRYLSLPRLKNEGAGTFFDNNAGERYVYNQEHVEIALGYAITRKAIDDNLYKSQFQPSNLGLQFSFTQYKEIQGASILNLGTTFDSAVGGDGKALFDSAHPIDGNTIANIPATPQDLNESSLLNAMTTIRQTWRDNAGLKIQGRARKLVVNPTLEPVAIRLVKTELRPGTADNDINAILSTAGGLPEGHMVNDYLTSNFAWFLLTNSQGLTYLQRIAFEMDMFVDFYTDNLLVKAYERFSFSYQDWRAIYGSFPTA
jgi:hypothetical protein